MAYNSLRVIMCRLNLIETPRQSKRMMQPMVIRTGAFKDVMAWSKGKASATFMSKAAIKMMAKNPPIEIKLAMRARSAPNLNCSGIIMLVNRKAPASVPQVVARISSMGA